MLMALMTVYRIVLAVGVVIFPMMNVVFVVVTVPVVKTVRGCLMVIAGKVTAAV